MAEVRSIEEIVAYLRGIQKRSADGIATINDALAHRDLMIKEGASFSAISTQINALLDLGEAVLDKAATDLAAVSYVYRELVLPSPEQHFIHVEVDHDNSGAMGHLVPYSGHVFDVESWDQTGAADGDAEITSTGHGLSDGNLVRVFGVTGETALNGWWIVANKATNTFELSGASADYSDPGPTGGSYYQRITPYSVFSADDVVRISHANDPDNNVVRKVAGIVTNSGGLQFYANLPADDTTENTLLTVELLERA